MNNPIHVTRLFRAERLRRESMHQVVVVPSDQPDSQEIQGSHRTEPSYLRAGRSLSEIARQERTDAVLLYLALLCSGAAFGWTLLGWLQGKGWM